MSIGKNQVEYNRAKEDFHRARNKARMQHLWSAITGKSEALMPYDEITRKVRTKGLSSKGLKDIPLTAIVGSVNRYQDFNRNFQPLYDEDMERWASVKAAMTSIDSSGLPPISVYKIGEAYFVLDGNHRVSISREMGLEKIEAYVTEIRSSVDLQPDDSPDEIILKAEHAKFLEDTQLDKILPDVEIKVSFPGQYDTLHEHLIVHRHYMGLEQSREISWDEAVRHWFKFVFKPVVNTIQKENVLEEFPELTETDLYIWILDHQSHMEDRFGWSIRPEKAASDLVYKQGRRLITIFRRLVHKILKVLIPKQLEDFSSPGVWHAQKELDQQSLFSDILVAMDGRMDSWIAFEQAIQLAQLESADVRGLVIENKNKKGDIPKEDLVHAFNDRLSQSGIKGSLAFARGEIAETISERARVNDLVVLKLSHPPSKNIFSRFLSGMRLILRRCSRPILVVRNQVSVLSSILLAYDGSRKGKEALFVASYFTKRYQKQLTVLVVDADQERGQILLDDVKEYLGGCCEKAFFRQDKGRPEDIILQVAHEESNDVIIMGGYGLSPVLEVLLGSTVDGVLRGSNIPVFICQ